MPVDPLSRVTINPDSGCWNWNGRISTSGYPRMHHGYGHRFYFELYRGPIPQGLTIDHLCRNTHCVNPEHLEAVSDRENTIRGNGVAGRNARRTHCRKGHEFTPENTSWREREDRHPWRECRTCAAEWATISRARKAGRT